MQDVEKVQAVEDEVFLKNEEDSSEMRKGEAPVEENPAEALAVVLKRRAEVEQREAAIAAERERIEAEAQELHFKLACGGVSVLFELFDDFAGLVKEGGAVHQAHRRILECLESISHHDGDVAKSLASGTYRDVVGDHPHFDWWLNLLQGYLVPAQPLYKTLSQIFSKPSGNPLAD